MSSSTGTPTSAYKWCWIMFEVGVARTFHALHQLEADDLAASGEHDHDYRAEVVARGDHLDENAMLVDLDLLGAALSECLAELDSVDLGSLAAFAGRNTTVETVADHVWTHVLDGSGRARRRSPVSASLSTSHLTPGRPSTERSVIGRDRLTTPR